MAGLRLRKAVPGWQRGMLWAVTVLLAGGLFLSEAAGQGGAFVSEARYSVSARERHATVEARLKVIAVQGGWHEVPLIPSSTPLRSVEIGGRKAYIERGPERYVGHVRGKGEFSIRLEFVLEVAQRGRERSIELPLAPAAGSRAEFLLGEPGYRVRTTPEVPIELSAAAGGTHATLHVGGLDSLTVTWLPEEIEPAPAPVFEATERGIIELRAGAALRESEFTIQVRRGELDSLDVSVPPGVDVLSVRRKEPAPELLARIPSAFMPTADIDAWRIVERAGERLIRMRLSKPVRGEFVFAIASEEVTGGPGEALILRPFRIVGARHQGGRLVVASMPSLRVIDTGSTAALAPVTEEPIASRHGARVPIKRLAFLYHSLPVELRLRVAPVQPQVVATAVSHARLQAGLVELLTRISYRIGDAPLERLRIGLDEGLIVLGVSGRDIRMWHTEGDVLEVRLSRPVSGDYELAVNCVQHLRKVDGVLIPHVRALDAERESVAWKP